MLSVSLPQRLTAPDSSSQAAAPTPAGRQQQQGSRQAAGAGRSRSSSVPGSSRAPPPTSRIVGSSFEVAAAEPAPWAAAQQAAGMDYEHVTAEEQATLTRDQCNFLERKRRAAASRS